MRGVCRERAEEVAEEGFVGRKTAADDGGGAFDGGPEGGGGVVVGRVAGAKGADGEEAEDGGYADAGLVLVWG